MAFVEAFGIFTGALGIIQFGLDNFQSSNDPGSTYKVAVALEGGDGGPPTNTGGDLPDVRVWNDNVDFVGIKTDPGHVSEGNLAEIHVEHDNQGVYSLFSANNDAICIGYLTTTWSDLRGGNMYAVSGDFGYECGATWYYSGLYPTDKSDYQPKCFWIDGDGDQPKTGFQVRWPAFSTYEFDGSDTDPSKFCNGVDFGLRTEDDPSTVTYYTRRSARDLRQREAPKRRQWMASQLVLSNSASHSAVEICNSTTSVGPDFAHVGERLFCDMGSKTVYSFCGEKGSDAEACYDADSQTLSDGKASAQKAGGSYELVRDWRKKSA